MNRLYTCESHKSTRATQKNTMALNIVNIVLDDPFWYIDICFFSFFRNRGDVDANQAKFIAKLSSSPMSASFSFAGLRLAL